MTQEELKVEQERLKEVLRDMIGTMIGASIHIVQYVPVQRGVYVEYSIDEYHTKDIVIGYDKLLRFIGED